MGRILVTMLTLLSFTACTTLQALPDARSVQAGDTVELELNDGTRHVLEVKSVDGQALSGIEKGVRQRIALADIRSLSRREMTTSSKVWIGIGIAAVLAAVIAGSGDGGGGGSGGGY
jgi:hypothetical protein